MYTYNTTQQMEAWPPTVVVHFSEDSCVDNQTEMTLIEAVDIQVLIAFTFLKNEAVSLLHFEVDS